LAKQHKMLTVGGGSCGHSYRVWPFFVAMVVGWGKLPQPPDAAVGDLWHGMPHAAGLWAEYEGKVAQAIQYLQTRNATAEDAELIEKACSGIRDKLWCRNLVLKKDGSDKKAHPPDGVPLQLEMLKLLGKNIRARHSSTFGQRYGSGLLSTVLPQTRPQPSSVQGHPVVATRVQNLSVLQWGDRAAVQNRQRLQETADQLWNFVAWDIITNTSAVRDVSRVHTHSSPLVVAQFVSPPCMPESDSSKWPALDESYVKWHEPVELKPRPPSPSEYRFNLSWAIAIHRCASHNSRDHLPDTRALLANIVYHQALVGIF
jgi:hypothetical protein